MKTICDNVTFNWVEINEFTPISTNQEFRWIFTIKCEETPLDGNEFVGRFRGPAIYPTHVENLGNGKYSLKSQLNDPGEYSLDLWLRWNSCSSFYYCNDSHNVISNFYVTRDVLVVGRENNTNWRWIKNYEQNEAIPWTYLWKSNNQHLFPLEILRNKWIHLHGDSLSRNNFNAFHTILAKFNLTTNFRTFDSPREKNESRAFCNKYIPEFRCNGVNCNTVYYDTLNFTLSFCWNDLCYPYENLYKHFVGVRNYIIDQHHPIIHNKSEPDWIIMNKGLHCVANNEHMKKYPSYIEQYALSTEAFKMAKIFWRNTGTTHFYCRNNQVSSCNISKNWKCRTPARVNELNRIADGIMQKLEIPIIDFHAMTLARPECSRDNRHFDLGSGVDEMYVSYLLNKILVKKTNVITKYHKF